MVKIVLEEINPTKAIPLIIFNEFDEEQPLKPNEIITNAVIPEAEAIIGKQANLYYNRQDDVFYYEYVDRPLTPEEKLQLIEQENQDLKNRIELMQQALDDLLLGGM